MQDLTAVIFSWSFFFGELLEAGIVCVGFQTSQDPNL